MGLNTKIEWTSRRLADGTVIPGHTWNPWRGCQHATLEDGSTHPGCENCYAEAMSRRNPTQLGVWGSPEDGGTRVRAVDRTFSAPLRWNKAAREAGHVALVFLDSMSDFFEDVPELPQMNDWRRQAFQIIDQCRSLRFLILTKRPMNVPRLWVSRVETGDDLNEIDHRKNVALLTSISDQQSSDELLQYHEDFYGLVDVVGLSAEPLVGPIDISEHLECAIDWVICGGESGPKARPMHPDWARSLRDQCNAADVAFFFKQWGEWCYPDQMPAATFASLDAEMNLGGAAEFSEAHRVGKKAAGRLLDGREWNEMPAELADDPSEALP